MKFGRQGLMILVILGLLTLLLAIVGPMLIEGVDVLAGSQEKPVKAWTLASRGVVESIKEVDISSQITGLITEVPADEGKQVKAGQIIIRFDDQKMLARLELAEAVLRQTQAYLAQLESGYRNEDIDAAERVFESKQAIFKEARSEAERMEQLFNTGAVAESTRDNAKRDNDVALAGMREAKANLEKLQKGPRKTEIASALADVDRASAELKFIQASLQDYTVLSPLDGLAIYRSAEIGETVDIGTHLFTIIDPDNLRVWAELEESDAGKVVIGQNVLVEVEAFPGKQFKGKVTQVFNAVQRKQQKSFDPVATFDINTQKIYILLDDHSELVHGLTVTVLFTQ